MKKSDRGIEILKAEGGFVVKDNDGRLYAIQGPDDEEPEMTAAERLLWFVMEFFNLGGSKHDKERLSVVREKGSDYMGEEEGDDDVDDGKEDIQG